MKKNKTVIPEYNVVNISESRQAIIDRLSLLKEGELINLKINGGDSVLERKGDEILIGKTNQTLKIKDIQELVTIFEAVKFN